MRKEQTINGIPLELHAQDEPPISDAEYVTMQERAERVRRRIELNLTSPAAGNLAAPSHPQTKPQ